MRLVTLLGFFTVLSAAEPGRLDFPLHTTVVKNEDVTVHVAWPVGADGAPAPEARDIVYYQPWWGEKNFPTDHGVFEELAKAFTVVGIFLDDEHNPKGVRESLDPESGSFDAIEAAIAGTRERLHLPPGKAFATGHSSGGCLIYWAAAAHPDAFEAIAPIAGLPMTDLPPPAIPTLHVHTLGDWTTKKSLAWHERSLANSLMLTPDPIWKARTNKIWLHLNSSESIQLTVSWLRGVADLRATNSGKLPPMAQWPVQMPAEQVAGTGEDHPTGVRYFPNQELATRFTKVHRKIEHATDAESGVRIARVTPRAGADRLTIVLVDPARSANDALYDAVLVAGKGATAIALQPPATGFSDGTLARLIAAEQASHVGQTCAVVAPAKLAGALAQLDPKLTRLVLDPTDPVAPGIQVVQLAQQAKEPEVQQQNLLEQACALIAAR